MAGGNGDGSCNGYSHGGYGGGYGPGWAVAVAAAAAFVQRLPTAGSYHKRHAAVAEWAAQVRVATTKPCNHH